MSTIKCCEWHDALPDSFTDDVTPDECWDECGLAGMGRPSVCCKRCPHYDWFVNERRVMPYLVGEIMALPLDERTQI